MKKLLLILPIGFLCIHNAFAQLAIHDRAIVAQQERMVFKQWDADRFYPDPNRILGIPTNPTWFLTWALHPNYPDLDRRPLSPMGEQTQRLGLAAAMNLSSGFYKEHADTVGILAQKEFLRISGALSGTDPLYQLYYRKELSPLENIEVSAFQNTAEKTRAYVTQTGAYDWYLENMQSLAERYGFAKTLDMERGQRILMYHRIMLDMRKLLTNWEYKLSLSGKMLALRENMGPENPGQLKLSPDLARQDEMVKEIIQRRILMR